MSESAPAPVSEADVTPEKQPASNGLLDVLQAHKSDTAPLREDQLANAVAFLTNPKVVASSAGSKRSFLLGKGLTDAEIDEATQRASRALALSPPVTTSPPAASAVAGAAPPSPAPARATTPDTAAAPLTWTQTALSAGLAVSAAYGVTSLLAPVVARWWRRWHGNGEPAGQDAKVLQLLREFVQKQEDAAQDVKRVASAVQQLQTEKEDEMQAQDRASEAQRADLQALRSEVHRLHDALADRAALSSEISEIKSMLHRQAASGAVHSGRSSPEVNSRHAPMGPAPGGSGVAHHSTGQANGAFVGSLPVPAAPASGQMLFSDGPQLVPTHGDAHQNGGAAGTLGPQLLRAGETGPASAATSDHSQFSEPHKPKGYLNILRMLERGETPPGTRTDISDQPPDPTVAPTASSAPRRPKPWERRAAEAPRAGATAFPAPSTSSAATAPWQATPQGSPQRPPPGALPAAPWDTDDSYARESSNGVAYSEGVRVRASVKKEPSFAERNDADARSGMQSFAVKVEAEAASAAEDAASRADDVMNTYYDT